MEMNQRDILEKVKSINKGRSSSCSSLLKNIRLSFQYINIFISISLPLRSSICFLHLTNPPQTQAHQSPRSWQSVSWSLSVRLAPSAQWKDFSLGGSRSSAFCFPGSRVSDMNHVDHICSPGIFVEMLLFALVNMV